MNRYLSDSSLNEYIESDEDEKAQKQMKIEQEAEKETRKRTLLFQKLLKTEDKLIYKTDELEFLAFGPYRIKFYFQPSKLIRFIQERYKFYITLIYNNNTKSWLIKHDTIPVNYKQKVYKFFRKDTIVTDSDIMPCIHLIHQLLCRWSRKYQKFEESRLKRYRNNESIDLDSDEEQMFLTEKKRVAVYRKKMKVLKRMIPPG